MHPCLLEPNVLVHVLQQPLLSVQDICNASVVCKSWRDAALSGIYTLRFMFPYHRSAATSVARLPYRFTK
eukprot:scaffold48941_cov22-Tisochrysis_lutea.AAC.1